MKNGLKILFTSVLSLLLNGLFAQDLDETFRFGQEQFAMGNSRTAALAFERVLYFGQNKYLVSSLDYLAQIEISNGNSDRVIALFGQAAVASDNSDQQAWYILRKSSMLLKTGSPQFAKIELFSIPDERADSIVRYRNFLLGAVAFSMFEFAESRQNFINALPPDSAVRRTQIDSLFNKLDGIKSPNPKVARILSMIIPGLGQLYAGDIKNGINSFLLTSTFIVLGVSIAINYALIDAIGSAVPWFQRYYMGGYQRAENIARERLREKQDAIYQEVLRKF